jgi:hypothetical protein
MAVLNSAAVYYESAQTPVAFAAMTGNSTRTTYSSSSKPWSSVVITTGVDPYVVAPYGLVTGGEVTVGVANDSVRLAALTAMMPGVATASATTGIVSVNAVTDDSLTVTRGTSAGTAYAICSLTITSAGAAAIVAGAGSTAHISTRGSAGGPPSIPLGSIEIAQIKTSSSTAAAIASTEIYQVVGDSQERYDYPVYSTDPIRGQITFSSALPLVHGTNAAAAATAAKLVYARVATPVFAEVPRARNFVPANTTNSTNSEQYYDGALGSYSSSIGQAQFEAALNDGVTDALLAKLDDNLLFKFSPDKNKAPYIITQGVLGATQAFSVGANPTATFTISPLQSSVLFAS